jgi:hypothetical protein
MRAPWGRPVLGGDRRLRGGEDVVRKGGDQLRPVEQPPLLLGREAVLDVLVLEDLVQGATALVLPHDVAGDVLLGGASLEEEREEVLEPRHETRLYPG